jgi:hypothetical protein
VVMLAAAGAAFCLGVLALGEQRDITALYWLLVGGLSLKAAVDMLRPSRSA